MDALDKERWIALSPLLDQLLDRDEEDRQRWLAQLRAHDAATADELEALLAQDLALSQQGFMGRPAAEQLGAAAEPTPPEPQTPDLKGQSIGPYELERELGQGGMGAVWLGRRADGRFQGEVAIKFLKAGLFGKGDNGRFAREGQILGRLSHPHIARLLDAGVHQGHQPYLVLEYVNGLPIDRYCHIHGLDIEARIRLFLDVLAAVAHAHQRLILHRDLKPSNILVTAEGEVKLLDFGIAKLMDDATQPAAATELTQMAGSAFTPQYAAPEQIQQGDVTTATDVYALGVLLYQLLGGRHPTADDTQTHLDRLKAVVELVPKRLSEVAGGQLDPVIARQAKLLKGDLDTIVGKALKKAPTSRYANADQFADDLRRWLAHEPIGARPDTRLYVLGRFVRRHRLAVSIGGLAVLSLVGLTTFSVLQAHRAAKAEQQALQRRQQADDLLSFMLGELADKLRPIGRLELLDSVGAKALAYMSEGSDIAAPERLQRAKALTVLGEVRVSKRDLENALAPLQAAARLIDGAPPNQALRDDWYKAQGTAAFWEGHAYWSMRRYDLATTSLDRYRTASQAWLDAVPTSKEALTELSYAQNSLGTLRMEVSDLRGAAERFTASIELKRKVLDAQDGPGDPAVRIELADSLSWLGSILLWEGALDQSSAVFKQAVEVVSQVRKGAPGNNQWAYREAVLHRWMGVVARSRGELEAAKLEFESAVSLLATLKNQDPSNLNWQMNLLHAESLLLDVEGRSLSPDQRLARWRLLKERSDEIARHTGAGAQRRRLEHQGWIIVGLASALADTNNAVEAIDLLEQLAQQLRTELNEQSADTRLISGLAEVVGKEISLLGNDRLPTSMEKRQQICGDLVDRIGKIDGLIGVHLRITSSWVQAQSCLGAGDRADVRRMAEWVASRDAALTPLPRATTR
ncbi:Protein kinase domain-containing protein [Roseateles sp. YR242]|uniref:serine/threonine-protein kinase n=1 Tax=Roseateles sp. YR242 TaxID=1855305 RepID=UPI0008AF51C2|nr:serine/threonine-protein kinase [Roseateles sp. YR242]SEK79849.1 Protein kinase domain-containing protein [Roseateles sp. YR242]